MTKAEIKTHLHERIEHLTERQLKQLWDMLDKDFIVTEAKTPLKERPIGSMEGMLVYMADDFDAPLDDFKDYMPDSTPHE